MRRVLFVGLSIVVIGVLMGLVVARVVRVVRAARPAPLPKVEKPEVPGLFDLSMPAAPIAKGSEQALIMYRGLACFDCHNILTMDPTDTGVLFSHAKHLARGFHCGQCHGSGAHTKMIRPGHDQCLGCHDGKTAPSRCVLCHADRSKIEPETHTASYIQTHGKHVQATKEFAKCHECHDDVWCTECHGVTMPHPRNWAENVYGNDAAGNRVKLIGAGHGPHARKQEGLCYRCHLPSDCEACHHTQMPHRTDYIRQHPVTMDQKDRVCSNCHTSKFCEDCHTRERDIVHTPGKWIQQHGAVAKKDDSQCMICHSRGYCDKCHKTKNPHGEDFLDRHKIYARTDPFVCRRCHEADYCTTCHEVPHPSGWGEWHKQAGVRERGVCLSCHQQDFCDKCHGLPMPHPQDFAYTHKDTEGAALTKDSLCMKCHDLKGFCGTCHDLTQ
jgi:hypothetical protein